jgi:hypothetical protein
LDIEDAERTDIEETASSFDEETGEVGESESPRVAISTDGGESGNGIFEFFSGILEEIIGKVVASGVQEEPKTDADLVTQNERHVITAVEEESVTEPEAEIVGADEVSSPSGDGDTFLIVSGILEDIINDASKFESNRLVSMLLYFFSSATMRQDKLEQGRLNCRKVSVPMTSSLR